MLTIIITINRIMGEQTLVQVHLVSIKLNTTTLLERLPSLSRSVILIEHTLVQVHLVGIKLNTTTLLEHLP